MKATHEEGLIALREAVRAKLKYWDAMSTLEAAFGFMDGDIPDAINDAFVYYVEDLAVGVDDVDALDINLDEFMEACGVSL